MINRNFSTASSPLDHYQRRKWGTASMTTQLSFVTCIHGVNQLEQVFFQILNELNAHREDLPKNMRYGGERLRTLLDGLSEADREDMRSSRKLFKSNHTTTSIKVKNTECPKLTMINFGEDKELQYGVYPFISDAVTLIKHMNELIGFSASECFKNVEAYIGDKFEDDNFF